jgi:hypothetical protein
MTPNRALLLNLICRGCTWESASGGSIGGDTDRIWIGLGIGV